MYLNSREALIAILSTVWPIEALSKLIVFTEPWDFEKELFQLFTLAGSHRITQKATCFTKYFFCTVTKLSHMLLSGLLFLAATVNCSELINKLHLKF